MDLKNLQSNWEAFGQEDPLWAILTDPDKKGNKWTQEEFFKTGWFKIRDVMQELEELKIEFSKDKALDFGCGVGRLTRHLGEHFKEVNGVDIAPTMIEKAKELNILGDRCHFHLNEKDDLTLFKSEDFDMVYSNITLQHIRPVYSKNYIKEFMRILKPGGVTVFQLPEKRIISSSEKVSTRIKDGFRAFLPESLINRYKAFRQKMRGGGPYMEMNGVPKEEVEAIVNAGGGKILDVKRDLESGDSWVSYQYIIQKQ